MPNITYDKPFQNYNQLIQILESRNVIVNDKKLAEMALQNFSYYDLVNGYKNTFIQKSNCDDFVVGTKFEEIYTLHILNMTISNILFKNILLLEKALKSRLSYLVAENYGVFTDLSAPTYSAASDDYLSEKYYSNSNNRRRNILIGLKKSLIDNPNHSISVEHYKNTKNHIPPWVLTTAIPYGSAIEWYRILRANDKETICNSFISPGLLSTDKTKEFLLKSLDLTKEYRNKIAHGNRVFNVSSLPILPKEQILTLSFGVLTEQEYKNNLGQSDLFAVLLILLILIDDPYLTAHLINELENAFKPYKELYFSKKTVFEVFGLPENIIKRLEKLHRTKFNIIIA